MRDLLSDILSFIAVLPAAFRASREEERDRRALALEGGAK